MISDFYDNMKFSQPMDEPPEEEKQEEEKKPKRMTPSKLRFKDIAKFKALRDGDLT